MNTSAPSADLTILNSDKSAGIFANEETILKALGTIRHSAIPTSDKDKLRDLFLSYTGTSDEAKCLELKAEVLATLKQHEALAVLLLGKDAATKVPQTATIKVTQSNGIGRTRPSPTFDFVASKTITTPTPPLASTQPSPTSEPTKVPETISTETPTPNPVIPATSIKTPIPAATTPTPEAPSISPVSLDARKRINEIKFDINKQVGNPVNLIEADEKIGRAYMTSLLDAMKRSSRGDTDLSVLEANYQDALRLIKEKSLNTSAPEPDKPEPVSEPVPEPAVETEKVPEPAPIAEPTPSPIVVQTPTPTPEPTPPEPEPAMHVPEPLPTPDYSKDNSSGLYHQPSDEIDTNDLSESSKSEKGISSLASRLLWKNNSASEKPKDYEVPKPSTPNTSTVKRIPVATSDSLDTTPAPIPNSPTPKAKESDTLKPVTATTNTLDDKMVQLKTEANAREAAAKRPITDLSDPTIDAGLKQLLSEWILFRSSGFFGSGPSGINHPLYKKLAQLPMAAVVAGRFEGVNPEIKRHLSDYMTGWRYEQGVLHEMGETFEHYLRRVIKQILTRQRTSLSK